MDALETALSQYRPLSPKDAAPLTGLKPAQLEETALQALLEIGGDEAGGFLISVIDNFLQDLERN